MARPPLGLRLLAAMVAAALLVPLGYLLLRAFAADPATLSGIVFRWRNLELMGNTAALTGLVLAFSTLIALPLAWLTTRSDLPHKKLFTVLAVLPLAVPGYVMAYALIGLAGYSGLANALFGLRLPRPEGLLGAATALTLYIFPYLFLNLRAALLSMDAGLEETARSLGCAPLATFRRVTLPHLLPALASGWLITALYVIGDFGVVALMRFEVFSYAIFTQYSAAFDRTSAAWLSLMLLAVTLVLLLGASRLSARRRLARVGTGLGRRAGDVPLGRLRPLAYAFLALVHGVSLGLPLLTLGYWMSFVAFDATAGQLASVFLHTLSAAAPAAAVACALAVPLVVLLVRYPSPGTAMLERFVYLGYAVPPLAFGLALVFFALGAVPWVYQSLTLLVAAYALHFLALAIGPLRSALMQMGVRPEQAARALGYGRLETFAKVTLPRLRKSVIAGALMVFIVVVKELPITFLLAPPGFTTLATRVFSYTSEGMLYEAAPYAALLVAFSSLFVGLVVRYEGGR
ncbi:iron ABC transporter permease [Xanthobacter sp. V4C-4]|uniref:ABC transporter permease n=1 Tax=Xanthobacter cornucopiae TaxID=3119924 RepID=UPI0037278995